jgi:hypothetical protein
MYPKFKPEDFNFQPFAEEQIPQKPPEETVRFADEMPLEARKAVRVFPYLSTTLLECSWRLVELSHFYEGRFREGMDISLSCRSASTGAITAACAGFEAKLNEELFNATEWAREHGSLAKARLLELAMKLTPRDRLDALAATYEEAINWGSEPYQSLDLILSIRKHLLHHEVSPYDAVEGHWPAKKLRDLQERIKSPYPNNLTLNWDQHVLTPAGAEWVVRVICEIVGRRGEWWRTMRNRLEETSVDSSKP